MYLYELKNIPREKLNSAIIQFMVNSEYFPYKPFTYCCNIKELFNDWYGDCVNCPENYAMLLSATLFMDGVAYPIEHIGLNDDITFETLMRSIEESK